MSMRFEVLEISDILAAKFWSCRTADADPLSKHLTEVYGYSANHESDSDNSSYMQGSRSTIATLDVCESTT